MMRCHVVLNFKKNSWPFAAQLTQKSYALGTLVV